jgi:hypothetical protein
VWGVCVRVCSIWGWGINLGVMLKRNMGQYLHVLVVSCMPQGCCGSSSGSRASLDGCVGVVGTITILLYGHLLYFHTCFHCVYFSLGHVKNYLFDFIWKKKKKNVNIEGTAGKFLTAAW